MPLKPLFRWTGVIGAEAYELLVATDYNFNHPAINRTGEFTLPGNAWQSEVNLDYATTYYWKVRAVNTGIFSSWSAVGIFTTENDPDQPVLPPSLDKFSTGSIQAYQPGNLTGTVISPSSVAVPETEDDTPAGILNLAQPVPAWLLYLIAGLMAVIFLTLIILLAMVLKLRLR
jgi:hypothetical protein